ncbi:MAG TPA: CADD family putative folate metabolism protein [Pyrinomonadaceae bacterium]|nr:CADD family putative folate metabolism protein [Pyrinomonadaceae bacterium]
MKEANKESFEGTFDGELLQAIMQHSMLAHPFYQAWSGGQLSRSILGQYAKQYYAHVQAFPTYVSAVHSRCPDLSVRQRLLENLIEEEHGHENHPELWLRFAEGLGVAREDVRNAELLPSTADSVRSLRSLTQSDDYREGLAALYAYESQIPAVARTKREGLKNFYGMDDPRMVSFFTVHESIDVLHQQSELEILSKKCDNSEAQARAVAAARKAAGALLAFLDGVSEAYLSEAH